MTTNTEGVRPPWVLDIEVWKMFGGGFEEKDFEERGLEDNGDDANVGRADVANMRIEDVEPLVNEVAEVVLYSDDDELLNDVVK
jgi:hypothetical protein